MTKKIYSVLAAVSLLVAGAAMTGCNKEDKNEPNQPAQVKTYKMSITANKGTETSENNGPRKTLSLGAGENTLTATWNSTDEVKVYNETKNAALTGALKPQGTEATAQLTGELTGTVEAGDNLKLEFLSPDYAEQDGTLDGIDGKCNYATASVTVDKVEGTTIYTSGTTTFENQQAIVKFTLNVAVKPLVIEVDGNTYTVTPSDYASELYVALPGFTDKAVKLTATAADGTYTKNVAATSLENGKYYQITATLAKATPAGALTGNFTVAEGKKVVFSQGNLQYDKSNDKWSFMEHQYSTVETTGMTIGDNYASQNIVSLFGWVGASSTWTGLAQYGISSSTTTNNTNGYGNNASESLKSDWGKTMGEGWFTLSSAEWKHLLEDRDDAANRRALATVMGKQGMLIFPDNLKVADKSLTATISDFTTNTITTESVWTDLENAGVVFLPAAGDRNGASVNNVGSYGSYWSSSPNSSDVDYAYSLYFSSDHVGPQDNDNRNYGCSVRLVRVVE